MRIVTVAVSLSNPTALILDDELASLAPSGIASCVDGISLRLERSRDPLVALATLCPAVAVADDPLVLGHRTCLSS
jgi:hypothetical protein